MWKKGVYVCGLKKFYVCGRCYLCGWFYVCGEIGLCLWAFFTFVGGLRLWALQGYRFELFINSTCGYLISVIKWGNGDI